MVCQECLWPSELKSKTRLLDIKRFKGRYKTFTSRIHKNAVLPGMLSRASQAMLRAHSTSTSNCPLVMSSPSFISP